MKRILCFLVVLCIALLSAIQPTYSQQQSLESNKTFISLQPATSANQDAVAPAAPTSLVNVVLLASTLSYKVEILDRRIGAPNPVAVFYYTAGDPTTYTDFHHIVTKYTLRLSATSNGIFKAQNTSFTLPEIVNAAYTANTLLDEWTEFDPGSTLTVQFIP